MANSNMVGLRFMRLRDAHGYTGHALSARVFVAPGNGVAVHTALITGSAQSRIVSISRGSPPPKLR